MSAHDFWDNFSHGFMHGMFGSNPFFGHCNMSFRFPFCNNISLFMVPNVMNVSFYQLMPDIQMPVFNMPAFEMPKWDFSNLNTATSNFEMPTLNFNQTSNVWSSFSNTSAATFPSIDTFTSTRQATVSDPDNKGTEKTQTAETAAAQNTDNTEAKTAAKTQAKKSKSTFSFSGMNNHQYDSLIEKYAKIYNIEKEFLKAVIYTESKFDPNAKSPAGARGLMQLMPGTAKELGVTNITDPEQNIKAGAKYLRQQLDRFNGNKQLALAAYNAGPGNVRNGKIPQNGETPKYVRRVMSCYNEYLTCA